MDVKIVSRSAGSTVVEWHETAQDGQVTYNRSIMPSSEVTGKTGSRVGLENPMEGIPYGEPWQDLLLEAGLGERTAFTISNELRRMGIWTLEDLTTRAQDAVSAFQQGYRMDVQQLRRIAREQAQGQT